MAPADDEPAPRQTLAVRLAERNRQRALRAERLARLRPVAPLPAAASGKDGEEEAGEAESALEEFLRALSGASAETAVLRPAPAPAPEPGAILHFQRPDRPAEREPRPAEWPVPAAEAEGLERLPGAGPGLRWTLERAGLRSLAEVAALDPEELACRLGPIGRLVPVRAWIAAARAAARA